MTSETLKPFGTSIFAEVTALALAHQAVNLGQGFPDFDGPAEVMAAAKRAMDEGQNQYARSMGAVPLVQAIARHRAHFYDFSVDPMTEVGVTCGATEGIAASILGLVNAGDEVILFEPFYDSYPACVALAGGVARFCTLRFDAHGDGRFGFDREALKKLFTPRTRLLVLNTPHNPTGKVFTRDELEFIAELCIAHKTVVLADEVYEHLTFDDAVHVPIATLPGMRERTLTLSSGGKTFSMTGWKVGWAVGDAKLVGAMQSAHQFLTYAAAHPFQHAIATALHLAIDTNYLQTFRAEYAARRHLLESALRDVGFQVGKTEGTYFSLADLSLLTQKDDRAFATELITRTKVAAIPSSVFYKQDVAAGQKLMRFAFCKQLSTLQLAGERLQALQQS